MHFGMGGYKDYGRNSSLFGPITATLAGAAWGRCHRISPLLNRFIQAKTTSFLRMGGGGALDVVFSLETSFEVAIPLGVFVLLLCFSIVGLSCRCEVSLFFYFPGYSLPELDLFFLLLNQYRTLHYLVWVVLKKILITVKIIFF